MSSGLLHGGPEIAARLRELGGYLRLRGESPFRARAYETAAAAIDALGSRFPLLRDEGRLTEVPGIGDKLAATIEELATTGTTATLERHRAEFPVGLLALAELPGVTLPRLRVLHTDLGIVDRATLLTAAESGELARVKGWGPRTITKLLAALSKGPESRPGMLLLEARPLAHDLAALLRAAPGVSAAEVVGDVRRWQEIVSAIHIVGASRDPRAALGAFLASAPVGEVSAPEVQGAAVTARFRLFNGGMAAVTVVPPEQYARTLVRCTGTLSHLDALAARAQARGTTMEAIDGSDEAAIFARLDLPLLPPELREHPDDIEQAAAGDDFADLVALPRHPRVRSLPHHRLRRPPRSDGNGHRRP